MVLQVLDIKNNCPGIYYKGEFIVDPPNHLLEGENIAWKHSPILNDEEIQYLFPLLRDQKLVDFSSDPFAYEECERKIIAQRAACNLAKIDLSGTCFYDLVPRNFLNKWLSIRQEALETAQTKLNKGEDYDILHKAHVLVTEISQKDLVYNSGKQTRVLYDIFGSATGRLTTIKGSIPVLTLKKDQRLNLCPKGDVFVEFDLNAAEVRTLLALSGQSQPQGDIHRWLIETVFTEEITREQAKERVFSWMYSSSSPESALSKFFSREIFRDFYSYGTMSLKTPFGRVMEVEERKAQNYLLQSTTSDIVVNNAYKIMKMLKSRKSRVAFTLHDSVVLDFYREDINILKQIKEQFETTFWGKFISTCKIGKTFGDLRKIKI